MALKPIIAICGTTAVGKSRLAIELALFLSRRSMTVSPNVSNFTKAKIINADSMQVYAGLDIVTNKVPVSEQRGVEHLLMGFVQPGRQYVVGEWVQDAVKAIEATHAEGQIPIIVGGTSYWIQHLLFPTSLAAVSSPSTKEISSSKPSASLAKAIQELPEDLACLYRSLPSSPPSAKTEPEPAFALHRLLSRLDPVMASRWHWKDTRKVLRSLNIILEHGKLASEVVIATHEDNVAQNCRYDSLVFWVYADPSALNARIDSRVDDMFSQGLLEEVRTLHRISRNQNTSNIAHHRDEVLENDAPDFESGIYQAIGYKEFVTLLDSTSNVPDPLEDKCFYEPALTQMKHNTRKYAQRQVKWLRNKLLPAARASMTPTHNGVESEKPLSCRVYLLDATEVDGRWDLNVLQKAHELTEAFLANESLPDPATLSPIAESMLDVPDRPTDPASILNARRRLVCPACTLDPDRPVMIEEGEEWEKHRKTRSHRRLAVKNSTLGTNIHVKTQNEVDLDYPTD